MRNFTLVTTLVLALGLTAGAAQAQTGDLSAVHGVPGLPAPVDVYADGGFLFSFDFGDSFGPAPFDAGTYFIEIKLGTDTILSGSATIEEGKSYTAVAHLNEAGDTPSLSFFENEISPLSWRQARLQIHHLAAAPTVDAAVRRGSQRFWSRVQLAGLSNGDQATAIDILIGRHNVGLLAGDAEVFNTGPFRLRVRDNLAVYAVGVFPDTFRLVYLPLD